MEGLRFTVCCNPLLSSFEVIQGIIHLSYIGFKFIVLPSIKYVIFLMINLEDWVKLPIESFLKLLILIGNWKLMSALLR